MLYYSLNYSGRRYQNVASQMKPHGTYETVTTHHNEVQILILLIFWLLPTFPNFEGKSQSTMTEAENKIHQFTGVVDEWHRWIGTICDRAQTMLGNLNS